MTKRTDTNDERPEQCPRCGTEVVVIGMLVDGTRLVMRACATCDTRTWHLGPHTVDVEAVLCAVGHSAGRRQR